MISCESSSCSGDGRNATYSHRDSLRREDDWAASRKDLTTQVSLLMHAANNDGPGRWGDVWRLVIGHRWYQKELDSRARRLLRKAYSPYQWLEDIKQDSLLALAGDLRREFERDVNVCAAESAFVPWLRCVTSRNCQQALQRIRRAYALGSEHIEATSTATSWQRIEDRIDLALANENLPEPERSAISLWMQGLTTEDISQVLQIGQRTTYRILDRARLKLLRLLSS